MKDASDVARLAMQDTQDICEGIGYRSVRRRLFHDAGERNEPGVEDNIANRFREEILKHREKARERWNFDFENEKPLEGRYEWVKMDRDGKDVPREELEAPDNQEKPQKPETKTESICNDETTN